MGVVTWKNIAPSNPAGILNAATAAAQAMGEGFAGVGTALQEGVDKKVQSETDQFVADLMALGTQEERDAMIGEANDAWLNIDTINKTNYELGAPDREMDMFNQQLAAQTLVNQDAAKLLASGRLAEIELQNLGKTKSKPSSGPGSTGWGDDPTKPGGAFEDMEGKVDDKWWMGPGFGPEDKKHFAELRADFIDKYSKKGPNGEPEFSVEEFNQLVNDGIVLFDDRASLLTFLPDWIWKEFTGDAFYFKHDEVYYDVDGSEKSNEALYEIIYNTYKNKLTQRQQIETEYLDIFNKNNPDVSIDIFMKIYEKSVKGDDKTIKNLKLANKIFATITKQRVEEIESGVSALEAQLRMQEDFSLIDVPYK